MSDERDEDFSPESIALAERLRLLRQRTGLHQYEVAALLPIRAPTISDWEMCKSEPKFLHVVKLSRLYNVSLDVIAGIEPMPPPTKSARVRRLPS